MIEKMRAIKAWLRKGQRVAVALGLALCVSLSASAVVELQSINDGVDRNDPNFVTAYLMVAGPGEEMFACGGHAFLRLVCPTFNLDNCYSYESESIKDKLLTFFCGKLRMGLVRIETPKYLQDFSANHRGVMQYKLNLPPLVKQRLWKLMDDRVAEGMNMPYDYDKRGCGWSVHETLIEAVRPLSIDGAVLPEIKASSRRERIAAYVSTYPWNRFFIDVVMGTAADRELPLAQRVVMPEDLLHYLQASRLVGETIITEPGTEVLPRGLANKPSWFTPMVASWLFVALSVLNFFVKGGALDVGFLALQSACGVFYTYLVFISNLPASDWHWLIVPFNLLPLVFWRWRRRWALGFVALLVLWEAGMVAWPHQLMDPALLVVGLAYIVFYLKLAVRTNGGQLKPVNRLNGHFKK